MIKRLEQCFQQKNWKKTDFPAPFGLSADIAAVLLLSAAALDRMPQKNGFKTIKAIPLEELVFPLESIM